MSRFANAGLSGPGITPVHLHGTFVISGFIMAALASSRLIVPLVAISIGASHFLMGVAGALFTAVPMLLSVPFGRWMDAVGTLPAIVFSASMVVIAAVLYGLMPTPYTLLAVAGLIGTAGVFTHMAATRAIGAGAGEVHRARWLGYLVLSYSFFTFIGPVIITHALESLGAVVAIGMLGLFALSTIIGTRALPHGFTRQDRVVTQPVGPRKAHDLLVIRDLRFGSSSAVFLPRTRPCIPSSCHCTSVGSVCRCQMQAGCLQPLRWAI
ncbi:MFS transporter [Pseudomonas sp. PNP]|uniref:MFS transporter n=1 Tax=Pseudomonas sp. PNP TaxID=361819 RepID=UPI001FEF0C33|nr:MFS transporter [Pseudomonas sp. PNP]